MVRPLFPVPLCEVLPHRVLPALYVPYSLRVVEASAGRVGNTGRPILSWHVISVARTVPCESVLDLLLFISLLDAPIEAPRLQAVEQLQVGAISIAFIRALRRPPQLRGLGILWGDDESAGVPLAVL